MLTALNYMLMKTEDSEDKTLSDTAERYAKENFFALNKKVR